MLRATSDVFFATQAAGIALEPGIGSNTVTQPIVPNPGELGKGAVPLVSAVNDGFADPLASSVLKVRIDVEWGTREGPACWLDQVKRVRRRACFVWT